jgi:putative membrane protein
MLWLKTFHIVFLVSWYAGLFYLPRLFVHHAMTQDPATRERLSIMERKLFWFITPWAVLTLVLGITLATRYFDWSQPWLHIKTFLALLLVVFHYWCYKLMLGFQGAENPHSHVWFRWFNEFPLLILVVEVYLVVFKPV